MGSGIRYCDVSKLNTFVTGAVDLPGKSVSGFKFRCQNSSYCHCPSYQEPSPAANSECRRSFTSPTMSGLVCLTNRTRDYEGSKLDSFVAGAVDLDAKSRLGSQSPCSVCSWASILSISARISDTFQAVTFTESFTGAGNFPLLTPAHQVDALTGIIAGTGGLAFGRPMIWDNLRYPARGNILDCAVTFSSIK
jgi:hypothetical protein